MKYTAVLALLGASALPSSAAIIAQESFLNGPNAGSGEYVAGSNVVPQSPTVGGFTAAWVDAPFNDVSHTVGTGSLNYSDPNYLGSTGGSLLGANGGRNGRNLTTSYGATANTTVYLSFLMQMGDTANANTYRAFEGWDGAGLEDGTNRNFQLGYHTASGGGDFGDPTQFGVRLGNSNATSATLGAFDTNVNLWVARFDFSSAAAGDSVTIWKNPIINGSEPTTGGTTVSGADLTLGSLGMARFSAGSIAVDEIRLGDTFADVTGVPEPSSVLLSALGALSLLGRRRRA